MSSNIASMRSVSVELTDEASKSMSVVSNGMAKTLETAVNADKRTVKETIVKMSSPQIVKNKRSMLRGCASLDSLVIEADRTRSTCSDFGYSSEMILQDLYTYFHDIE